VSADQVWNNDCDDLSPEPIVPVPAASQIELRGKRVIVGVAGRGWRADLRSDSVITQGGRAYVPVLTEYEWYRSEAEQIEVFAPLVPIERVWVETVGAYTDSSLRPSIVADDGSADGPPLREPVRLHQMKRITGLRVVRMIAAENRSAERALRAVTDAYADPYGDRCVRVAHELDWYRWAWGGKQPSTLEVPIDLLWIE
jgi:hypothetical protein